MKKSALIIVDTQVNMFDESLHVYNGKRILQTINRLIDQARLAQAEVIYVRNNGSTGEPDEPGAPGWHIHPAIYPVSGDLIVDKQGTDPFKDTDLQIELTNRGIDHLIVVGMQTEMCVSATVRQAAKLGYAVTLVRDGHTTFDWEEITAVEAIAEHNLDLALVVDVQKAEAVEFG
jgi:nicotinamidase-related amidase